MRDPDVPKGVGDRRAAEAAERDLVLARIAAPHFVAGLRIDDEELVVTDAAPILRYMIGWRVERVRDYAAKKGWDLHRNNLSDKTPV